MSLTLHCKSLILYLMFLKLLATGFKVGSLGVAPGTLGTLLTIPLVLILAHNKFILLISIFIFTLLGLKATKSVIQETGEEDPEEVIIDEVAGFLTAFLFVEVSLKTLIAGFIIFRLLDIYKPFPVNKFEELPEEWGVMADDIVAGFITSVILYLIF